MGDTLECAAYSALSLAQPVAVLYVIASRRRGNLQGWIRLLAPAAGKLRRYEIDYYIDVNALPWQNGDSPPN